MENEKHSIKYIEEMLEYWRTYGNALIDEIYIGIGINLGLSQVEASKLAIKNPSELKKAGFFKDLFDKFKNIFKHKVPEFRVEKDIYNKGKGISPKQWEHIDKKIDDFFKDRMNIVAEDIGIKTHMLARTSVEFEKKNKPYKNKSLYQVDFDQYDGDMPMSIAQAYTKYDFEKAEKQAINKSINSIGMYINQVNSNIQNSIRHNVQDGIDNNKSPQEIASDLYWQVEKNKDLVNEYTAEALKKDWNRIATTEMATVFENAKLAQYEADAMESLKDPDQARYFVFTGGSCNWCKAHHGVLVRLIPSSLVTDTVNDSLESMGIHDPNTDIAVWIGKNNVGFKETKNIHEWRVCTPAHPHNVATLSPIDIETEMYNPETGDVEQRSEKKKYVPKSVDYSFKSKEEKEARKPISVGTNLVRYNNNIYEAVDPGDYNRKLEESREDARLPIPINRNSPSYIRIFGDH